MELNHRAAVQNKRRKVRPCSEYCRNETRWFITTYVIPTARETFPSFLLYNICCAPLAPRRAATPSLLRTLYDMGMRERAGSCAVRRTRASAVVSIRLAAAITVPATDAPILVHVCTIPINVALRHCAKVTRDPSGFSLFSCKFAWFDAAWWMKQGTFVRQEISWQPVNHQPPDYAWSFTKLSQDSLSYLTILVAPLERERESLLDFFIRKR